ncbi:MAG: site-specific integrase, partial [Gemmatimonadota bacterium]|nr:site-specific integrase [Gemmatimonadota bacterium]
MKEYLKHLALRRNYSPHTVAAYGRDLAEFHAFLKDYLGKPRVGLKDLDRLAVRSYLAWLARKKRARTTINRKLSAIKGFSSFLLRAGLLESSPAGSIVSLKTEYRRPEYCTREQAEKLMEAFGESSSLRGLCARAMLELFYSSGLRLSELVGLNLADYDTALCQVRVLGKGSKERIVPVGRMAADAISRYLNERRGILGPADRGKPLFTGREGKRIAERQV